MTQKVLSLVPAGQWLNSVLQEQLGGLRRFEANVDSKIHDPEFRHYPRAQLCTTSVDFGARAPS